MGKRAVVKRPKPTPERDIRRTTLMLPHGLWKKLKVYAIDVDREMQHVVADAIREYLQKH